MRLIDADVLRRELIKGHDLIGAKYVDLAPDIDAVEVIRCKDCKYWYLDADAEMACEYTEMGQPEDGFCNWAERRSDEN